VLAFFVVLPMQYWLVAAEHFDMFAVFIPVLCVSGTACGERPGQ